MTVSTYCDMDLNIIIQKAKEKDLDALDVIYKTYYPRMVRVCTHLTREDKATVEDLVHDAFVIAFASVGNLNDNSKFNEWLTSIVRNVSLKHIQNKKKFSSSSLSSLNEEDLLFVDSSPTPDSDLCYKDLLELIHLLPEGYSRVLRLSLIEGFTHKEIAEMLNIAPHSSSSQLSRAKKLLIRIIKSRKLRALGVFLLPVVGSIVYFYHKHDSRSPELTSVELGEHLESGQDNWFNKENHKKSEDTIVDNSHLSVKKSTCVKRDKHEASLSGTDTIISIATPILDAGLNIVEVGREYIAEDSLGPFKVDDKFNANQVPVLYGYHKSKEVRRKNRKWQLLAIGSFGSSIYQKAYHPITINNSQFPESDGMTDIGLVQISTWEDYCSYLKVLPSPEDSTETETLIKISENNTGKIERRVNHERPFTFGFSIAGSFGKKMKLETGLQYSLLKSDFLIGENGYSIMEHQKVHYLGVPFRISYNCYDLRRFSAYCSMGVTLHVPVSGKRTSSYVVDWQDVSSVKENLDLSLKWQTSASLGLEYKFLPNAGVFVEPTFNWFVPSQDKVQTIWTERPFMFTCPLGIRFTW